MPMKKLVSFCGLFFLTSCSTLNPLSDFRFQTQVAPPYVLASWYRITTPGKPIHIYIEGDGSSFDSNGNPTDNPTPRDSFWRAVAAEDTFPNTAYLARPCQYMQVGACSKTDWTTGRFSKKIVQSMDAAVKALMKKAQTDTVILIGYSGGAQAAGLIAVQNPAVKKVITVAGILDTEAWTDYHHDTPLKESLNLKNYKTEFLKIPQIHYVGERDTVVPPEQTKAFLQNRAQIIVVPEATHDDGFDSVWEEIYQQ